MIKFFKSLFSDGDLIKTGVNAIVSSGDALVYTKEEQAQAKERQETWYLELMKALSPSAKSRRGVAWTITGAVLLFSIVATICQLLGKVEHSKWILEMLSAIWSWPFLAVVSFYFAPGMIPGLKK